jgi:gluconolactonase
MRCRWCALAALAGVLAALTPAATAATAAPQLTVINPDSAYPEGPSVVAGVLYYTEMGNDRVMRFDGEENHALWSLDGCGPTSVQPMGDGTLAVLCHRRAVVVRITRDGVPVDLIDHDRNSATFTNPNAAVSDAKGGIYFSSSGQFAPGARATGAILHLAADGVLTRVAEGIHYANGVAVSADGRTLYASEHLERRVLAYDIADDGSLSNRRIFVGLDDLEGTDPERTWELGPDGLALAPDGNLVIAEYGAGHLLVVDPAGALVATVPVPERYVTAAAFSADGHRMFITAPASLMNPNSGAVYEVAYPIVP